VSRTGGTAATNSAAASVSRHDAAMSPSGRARALTPDEVELIELATATIDSATDAGPDQDGVHTMGAAVRADDGRAFVGVNLYHFTGGPCAELVALGTARAQGARRITHVVAVGNHGRGVIGPCGRDRQILLDHYPGVRVLLPTPAGMRSVPIEDLLPFEAGWSIDGGAAAT
jgi:cytidine deaminase